MALTTLSQKQLNFARFSILCVDIIKLPLADILYMFIEPHQLEKKIKKSHSLQTGEHKLHQVQRTKCCYNAYTCMYPDYNNFDVTLLYKLIRHLCPSLEPTNKWGNKPTEIDLSVGDDIERIRELRNAYFAHIESTEISNDELKDLWKTAKTMIYRLQDFTTSNGCKTNYVQMILDLERKALTFTEYISYRDLPGAIFILGETSVPCGTTACFIADNKLEKEDYLLVSWDRVKGSVRTHINLEDEKYRGSDDTQLIINDVCEEDKGRYQAVISRNQDVKIFSKEVYLHPTGEPPCLENFELNVTSENKEIYLHYVFKKVKHSSGVQKIRWTKNSLKLDLSNNKYVGGTLTENCLTITSPCEKDKGEYTCIASNASGSVAQSVKLDIPSAHLLSTTKVVFGSDTKIDCIVSGYPLPNKVKWENSLDGTTFNRIDVYKDKYFGSSTDPCSPFLLIRNATLTDQQYFRVVVRNVFGKCTSNTVFLQVTGDRPNMSEGTCTLQGHAVKLRCDVFLYDESPALTDVYWTRGGIKLDTATHNGKYLGVNLTEPSLTINNVNYNDAGNYQLIALNAVGETISEVIVLGEPEVFVGKYDNNEDGSVCFTMTIKSVPVPHAVQWRMMGNDSETFEPINVNAAEYKGTLNTFPHPVLVIKHVEKMENCSFEIEVINLIGKVKKRIPDNVSEDILKRKQSTLGKFHSNGGFRVPFSKLLKQLADGFPSEKVNQLKHLIQVSCNIKEVNELYKAKNAADCFMVLWKEDIITTSNVIAMQFVLQETHCEELERKCVEYAKKQKAIYYYEKPPENGWRNFRYHVNANLHYFTIDDETKIRETVANIVDCSIEEVRVHGYLRSTSFFVVLAIKDIYIGRLYAMTPHDNKKLTKLNIDYILDGFKTIKLQQTTEIKDLDMVGHPNISLESPKEEGITDKGQNKPDPVEKKDVPKKANVPLQVQDLGSWVFSHRD